MSKAFVYQSFTQTPYEEVYQLQKTLVEQRIQDDIPDTLLMGQHPHVVTCGRGTHAENILTTSNNIAVVEIERGGDVTYHGPGQLVGYPIFKLSGKEQSLHAFLRCLEDVLIGVLKTFHLHGERKQGWTGVWTGERKIASIGVAVRKWVTYHGFALNVSTDLSYFQQIHPCGLPATVMTSMAEQGVNAPMEAIEQQVLQQIQVVFGRYYRDINLRSD